MTDLLQRFNDDFERHLAELAKIDAELDAQRNRIHDLRRRHRPTERTHQS
jgi:predicted short-subunit dehydrogenase-like oxidoreductase (DUF2520 family)